MDNKQRAKLDTCNRVKEFNTKHAGILSSIAEYAVETAAFNDALMMINKAAQVQSETPATASNVVQIAKENMANITIKYALRGMVKAKQIGELVLVNHLDHSIRYISKATKTLSVHRATNIKQHLNDNLAVLTNLTPENITEIENAIAAYNRIKDKPTINQQEKKATGTRPLPMSFTTAFKAIDNMYDLVQSHFGDSNPTLVNELALAKQIIKTGIHHQKSSHE
ncbi:hypothetical protein [Emticicia sp. SJ17W-69]|uniref:hypothetical protein n=1 Tax=Emticicia sp. SJ17W-69 TaxID=3421657 RepID=UPI003EBCB509